MFDGILFERFFTTIFFEAYSNKPELVHIFVSGQELADDTHDAYLFAPVSQVVRSNSFPPVGLIEVDQELANDCGAKMPDVELLGNVG